MSYVDPDRWVALRVPRSGLVQDYFRDIQIILPSTSDRGRTTAFPSELTGSCRLDEQARRRGCRTGRPGAGRRRSELRRFAFPRRSRGIVVERLHRVLLARDRERGQLLLGLEPVLHVATLRAAGLLPQLPGPLRDPLPQLVVIHVAISPSDRPAACYNARPGGPPAAGRSGRLGRGEPCCTVAWTGSRP